MYDQKLSRIGNDLRLLDLLGHGATLRQQLRAQPDLKQPYAPVSPKNMMDASTLLAQHGVTADRSFALFATQCRPFPVRGWPAERFRDIARRLDHEHGMAILFTGEASEAAGIDAIRAPLEVPSTNLAGQTPLLVLAAIMRLARIGVVLDTGTMHLAHSAGLPMVVIAPADRSPVDWLPLGNER